MVNNEEIRFKVVFRLVNIDIINELHLDNGVYLRKISEEEVQPKYPLDDRYLSIGEFEKPHWNKHAVEAVFELKGSTKDIKEYRSVGKLDELQNRIITPFMLTGFFKNGFPYATHTRIERADLIDRIDLGYHGYQFQPRSITKEEEKEVKLWYRILHKVNEDNVLSRSLDRFIMAMKRSTNHPNKVNRASWDKLVDYVISLETLFLTVNNNSIDSELSYRFRLNGSALLSKVLEIEKRSIYKILGWIYGIRSKTVHGANDKSMLKEANKIISEIEIDDKDHKHDIGSLLILSDLLENWIKLMYQYLADIDFSERPYRKEGGWEDLIWSE